MQKFDIKPRSAKILFGKNYMLRCSSSGIPQPSISWLFQNIDDSVIVKIKNSSKTIICQNGSLLLVNVNLVLSGVYICKSLSPGYISNVSATVEIYGEYFYQMIQPIHYRNQCLSVISLSNPTYKAIIQRAF